MLTLEKKIRLDSIAYDHGAHFASVHPGPLGVWEIVMQRMMLKFLSTTAWVLGATATSAALSEPASAVTISCNTSVTSQGSSSINAPTDVGAICNDTIFSVNQPTTPAYWEFNWIGTNDPLNIHSTATGLTACCESGGEGSFHGTLSLYDSSANLLASSQYVDSAGSFFPFVSTEAEINDFSFTPSLEYILGIEPPVVSVDPAITISFAAPATAVPEPATTGIVGGGIALLALLRRRRRKAA